MARLTILGNMSQWEDSVGKGSCHQAWPPELESLIHRVEREHCLPQGVFWSPYLMPWHTQAHTQKIYPINQSVNKQNKSKFLKEGK